MNIPFKINQREKRVILIGGIIVLVIIIYNIFSWHEGSRKSSKEYIDAKRLMLEKQLQKISEKNAIQKEFAFLNDNLKNLDRGLLRGSKPPVVAAQIQSILKEMASGIGIDITLEKALGPEDKGWYLGIPVEIGFTTQTEKLTKILYKIKASKFLLTISEMRIIVKNTRNPVDAYTTLVVNGFIKKPETTEDVTGEEKSAT
jgi:hypothetical protein